jgi:hypothetical protein
MNLTNAFLKSRRTLSQKLFEHVSSYDIYCHFIGYDLKVGDTILSPIRTDNRPTFLLFIPDDKDDVYFKDFAWVGGNVFKFVKLFAIYQESINLKTRGDIIRHIDRSMGIGLFGSTTKKNIVRRQLDTSFYQSKRIIRFKSREFTTRDLWYWKQYHIDEKVLNEYNVRSVRLLLNEMNEIIFTIAQRTLTFAYVIYNKVKLYRPEDKLEFKWRNTCPGHYIQGLEQLKKFKSGNKKLIITKSLKDVMVFHVFLGDEYDVIAPHSETYIFKDNFLSQLYKKYDEIIVIFDYDLAGVVGANRLRKRNHEKFKVAFVSTSRIRVNGAIKLLDKDISDYVVDREKEQIMKHLRSMGL